MTDNPHKKRQAGDFLLLFAPGHQLPPGRMNSTWVLEREVGNARLFFSSPGENWKGSPISRWQSDRMEYWMIGETYGELARLDPQDWPGHFVLLGLDLESQSWNIWTDRCGTFHSYYAVTPRGSTVSSFSTATACVTDKEIELEALAGFFSFGFFPQDSTYYKGLKIIRPATHLTFDQAGRLIGQERTWQWRHEVDESMSFDAAVDAFAALFHQVIREQTGAGRVAFPISGGLDSRSTIAALSASGSRCEPWCYSYGFSTDSAETRIAERIAHARDLPFEKYTIQPYLFNKLSVVTQSVEGFQDVTQCRQAYVTDELATHAERVMAAHWGDVWLDDMGLKEAPDTMSVYEIASYAYTKFKKPAQWLLERMNGNAESLSSTESSLCAMLESELNTLDQVADPDFRLKALKTELWSFRWTTASLRMFQPGAFPLLPFYDPRLVDFFCKIPTEYVAGRRLQIEYLKRYSPDLARIPWQTYDANLYWYKYFNTLLLPKRAIKKARRLLSHQPLIQRNWEVQFLSAGGRTALTDSLLGGKLISFFSQSEMTSLMENFYTAPSPASGYTLSMLLTFSAWLELNG